MENFFGFLYLSIFYKPYNVKKYPTILIEKKYNVKGKNKNFFYYFLTKLEPDMVWVSRLVLLFLYYVLLEFGWNDGILEYWNVGLWNNGVMEKGFSVLRCKY